MSPVLFFKTAIIVQLWQKDLVSVFSNSGRGLRTECEYRQGEIPWVLYVTSTYRVKETSESKKL